ncbi:MAG: FGGY family carbohydrate kinase [Chloroflexota bacterium]
MSARDVLVAIDVGTSGARAAAFDLAGDRFLEVRRPYPTHSPRPLWAEQSANAWISASLASLGELATRLGPAAKVHGISLTGQCPSIALLDGRGRPLGPGLTYRDNRAEAEADEIRERFGDAAIHHRTGHLPAAFHIAPKLRWIARNEPARWAAARLAVQPRDLVILALTGEAVTDGSHAAATLLHDLRGRRWDPELLDALEIPASLFPRLGRSTEVVGTLRPDVAARVGLPASTPVILGGADSQACAFGAGVVAAGPVSEMAGSSTCLNAVLAEPLDVLEVTHYPHVIADAFTTETGINTTGSAVAWIADRMYGGRRGRATGADYARLDAEASAVPPGADGLAFLPVLADGERVDPSLRGALTGLSLRHGRAEIARAVLEGVAFDIRAQIGLLSGAGQPVTELRVSGGDARLATWNRVKADATGLVVRTIPGDAAVTGVAMLAGIGAGIYRDLGAAIDACVHPDAPIEPDPATAPAYAAAFEMWQALAGAAVVHREEAAP